MQTSFRPYVKFTCWVNACCLIFQQMPSITFVFLVSEWRMWDSTVFLIILIHNTIKGQPLHDVENATAHWTSRAESTGFLLVISLLCSSVNCFSWARVQFVYLASAKSGFLPIVKYDPTIWGLISLFCRLVDILATTAQSYGFPPHTTTTKDPFPPYPPPYFSGN